MAGEDASQSRAGGGSPTGWPRPVKEVGYDFRFVEVGGPRMGKDEDARSVIRAHVMRDFYGKRRQGREPNSQAEIRSAASSQRGVSQQARRFRNGPQGLQEVAKKRKRNGPNKTETSPPLDQIRRTPSLETSPPPAQFLFGQIECGNSTPFTRSGESEARTQGASEDSLQDQDDTRDPDSRDERIRSDSLVPALGFWEPFNVLPVQSDTRTQILIYHASNGILSSPLMGQLRTEWLSLATKDLALFHIFMSHYAGNYGLEKQECDPAEALRFRMISMKLVNERLDDQEASLADGTMGTVASLSSYEATHGSLTAVETHLNGLRKMVELRGGIHESGMNSYTARLVLWADLNCANALACDPIFPTPDCPEMTAYTKATQAQRQSSPEASLQEGNTSGLAELQCLNKDLMDKFIDLRYLAGINSLPGRRESISKEEQIWKSDEVYFTERSLLTLSNISEPQELTTSCHVAAIIFIDNRLRGIAFIARIMTRHVARLKRSMEMFLDDASRSAAKSKTPQTILWTLCVGGIVAGSRMERDWFVGQTLGICDILDLQYWSDAEGILKQFLWPTAWDSEAILFWECVEKARLMRSDSYNVVEATGELEIDPYLTLL